MGNVSIPILESSRTTAKICGAANRVEHEKHYYKQDIETFIKHAERY